MLTKNLLIDHCRGLLGVPDIIRSLSDSPTPLEWNDINYQVDKAEVFDCISLCHSLNIFIAALTNCTFPVNGFCMADLLRYYIYQQWDTCSHFHENKKWREIVQIYSRQAITQDQFSSPSCVISHHVYMMAFVDLMTNIYFPVVIRLYIGPKMIGNPLLVFPGTMCSVSQLDIGPHHTLDLCSMNGIYSLMKTSSMTSFKRFSPLCNAKKCLSKPLLHDIDDIKKFWL